MGVRDWDIVTSYVDSVTTTLKTVTFPKVQEQVKVKNQGNANLTYTIGSQSGTLTPGQSVTVNESISSFTIQAASGTQAFEVRAKEQGTEQTETETDVMSLLAESAKKIQSFVSVLKYGADPSGATDSTQAFKDAVGYARTTMINNNLKNGVIVVIPAGTYKITDQIIVSPFVRIKTQGFVYIQSSVSGKSVVWFTNQTGDPNFRTLMNHEQYLRSPLINAKDGGMFIQSTLNKASGSIGLEIGSQSDLGVGFNLGRYSVCDVAIGLFDVALQMNAFNNYIGVFDNLHLETNNTNVRFGTSTSVVGSNRGENFSFRNGVFADSTTCFDWYVSGMACNFYGSSFDFNTTVFNFRKGFNNIGIYGGHIEGNTVIADATASPDTSSIPTLSLYSPVVLNNSVPNTYPLFKGGMSLLTEKVKWQTSQSTLASFLYMCDSTVQARELCHVIQGGSDIALSPLLNRIANSKFQSANLASGDAAMPINEFTVSQGGGMNAPVITATIPSGSSYTRAMKMTSTTASGSYCTVTTSNGYPIRGGDVVQMGGVAYYDSSALRGISFKVDFYDRLGNLISSSASYANKGTAVQATWNTFFGTNNVVAPAGADTVKYTCTISGLATGENAYIGELFLGVS